MTAKRTRTTRSPARADAILDVAGDTTLLDVLDTLLNKGVVLNGDVVLGVAGVDLVYLRLSSLLTAIDRVMPQGTPQKRRRGRGPRRLRTPR